MTARPTGLTRDAGWQIGVSRTYPADPEAVWDALLAPPGLALWLGDGIGGALEPGATYATADGTTGEVRSLRPRDRVRLTWQPPGRDAPATVQLAVRPAAGGGASVRLHTERLDGAEEREAMREHWRDVLDRLAIAFGADRAG